MKKQRGGYIMSALTIKRSPILIVQNMRQEWGGLDFK